MSEVNVEIITKTQKSMGKYVKKPILTEKLLSKPPFRFLHDIIRAVIRDTGFLNGLFTENELNYEKVKDKEAKVVFLTKLIDAVKYLSKTDIKVRPSKIVAGLEPIETNIFLQTIAKCIDMKIDTTEYVSKVNSGKLAKEKPVKKSLQIEKDKTKNKDNSINRTKKVSSNETPKSMDRTKDSSRTSNKDKPNKSIKLKKKSSSPKEDSGKVLQTDNNVAKEITNTIQSEVNDDETNSRPPNIDNEAPRDESKENPNQKETPDQVLKENLEIQPTFLDARVSSAGLARPKSARPKSGDRLLPDKKKNENVSQILESGPTEMKVFPSGTPKRPSSSLRPPSVRPSSARPGAPRLRPDSALPSNEPVAMGNIKVIVENVPDDEDTVIIQNAPEEEEDNNVASSDLLNVSGENKGQLVEQILEQIQEEGSKRKVEIDWEHDELRGKDATTKEVTQLRSLIQSLTKTANPLGKLMNYLHEDLDAMHNELQTWTNTKKQLYSEIEKQKKSCMESSKPLIAKLEHLKEEIKKQEREITIVRSTILKNEQRISELLGNK